ncbi:hypothetical protein Trydic_g6493 [Trypoxylus dichotomus]
MSSSEVYTDIPYITEDADEQRLPRRHYSCGASLQPSPYHSRSPSFRDDRQLLNHKSTSLEELRRYSLGSLQSCHYHIHRKSSSRKSRRSQHSDSDSKRHVHRNQSVRSYSRSPRHSYVTEMGVPSRRTSQYHHSQRRKSSVARYKQPIVELSEEEKLKENRRRKIVYIVIGTTLFLLLCAILAVVVTLTHQSEGLIENKTTLYYTFSPHPKVLHGDFLNHLVRRENEELMNSLNREHHNTPNGSSSPSSGTSSSSLPE